MSSPSYPADLDAAATRAATQASARWAAAATAPRRGGRIVTAATLAWDAAYPIAYGHGYHPLAGRAATTFTDLQQQVHRTPGLPAPIGGAVGDLVRIAQAARPASSPGGPPPRDVLGVAALAALDRLDGRTAPDAITEAAHRQAVRYGAMQGALAAAADIYSDWRARTDPQILSIPVDGSPLEERVNATLGRLNRDVVTALVNEATAAVRSAPQVARSSFATPATTAGSPPADIAHAMDAADRAPRRSRP
jgi:hypothetical protein